MKDLKKAIAMYFRISLTRVAPLIVLAELAGIVMILAAMSVLAEADDISLTSWGIDKLSVITVAHLMIPSFFLIGAMRSAQFRFFSTPGFAKQFSVKAPVISALILSVPFDIILLVLSPAYIRPDMLIINALNTVLMCFITASMNKSGLQAVGMLLMIPFFGQMFVWRNIFADGSGMSLPVAVAAALGIYIAGTALNIFIMDLWWKCPGRKMTGKESIRGDITAVNRLFHIFD
ncbi:MAG: hypothetical protein ILP19_09615 [Oscillospiraceae bacterium]|nr:hypothetical protein [Oscillospiraceae bacterium]